jgi:4-amino-4-deoxy-L-arabinose transferase-like glycosyltransferase
VLVLLIFCVAFGVRVAGSLGQPITYIPGQGAEPVDSYNDAVFSLGARALRESGPLDAKLGGDWGAGDRYADHPPLIYPATAVSQVIVGDNAFAPRFLAFLASVTTVFLLFALLRQLGVGPIASAVSVAIGLGVPMFLDYGTMLDTLTVGLPFAAAYLLVWQRNLDGRSNPFALAAAATALALVAWQGLALVAFTIVVTLARRMKGSRIIAVGAGAGGVCGALLTSLWMVWVGDLDHFFQNAHFRAGEGGAVTLTSNLEAQGRFLRDLFGVAGIGCLAVAAVALVLSSRFRPIGIAALGTVLAYAFVFREGSFKHDYWNYWFLLPLVLGIGAAASWVASQSRRWWLVAACVIGVAVVAAGFTERTEIANLRSAADASETVVAPTRKPVRGQRWIPVVALPEDRVGTTGVYGLPQARYNLRAPLKFETSASVAAYVRRYPDHWVIVGFRILRGPAALAALGVS